MLIPPPSPSMLTLGYDYVINVRIICLGSHSSSSSTSELPPPPSVCPPSCAALLPVFLPDDDVCLVGVFVCARACIHAYVMSRHVARCSEPTASDDNVELLEVVEEEFIQNLHTREVRFLTGLDQHAGGGICRRGGLMLQGGTAIMRECRRLVCACVCARARACACARVCCHSMMLD